MDPHPQKESKQKDANKENIRLCDKSKGEIYTKEEESIPLVKIRKKRSVWVYQWKI